VFTPPADPTDAQVLAAVRAHWAPDAAVVEHVPVGFGAWHWRVDGGGGQPLFVTLDPPLWHTARSAEATYSGAAALAATLEFVHPPQATRTGGYTVPMGNGWLSATRWLDGERPSEFDERAIGFLRRLHAAPAPEGIVDWEPQIDASLVDELSDWTSTAWSGGPWGESAREMVRNALPRLDRQLSAYFALTARLGAVRFVPTHGEPGAHNQWRTQRGDLLLVDWESLRRAPRERDLWALPESVRRGVPVDAGMAGLFQLDWILGEVRSYSQWLRGPHVDDSDTRTALAGLRHELTRPAYPAD